MHHVSDSDCDKELSSSLDWYLSQKDNDCRLLTVEEEIILAKEVEAGSKQARRILIESNIGLVVAHAVQCRNCGVSLPDLIQEGNIGLINAVENFNYRKGCRFSTYAVPWIRNKIAIAVRRRERIISLPDNIARQLIALERTSDDLLQKFGRAPTLDELASKMELSVEEVEELVQYRANLTDILSLEQDCERLIENLRDLKSPDPCQVVVAKDSQERTIKILSTILTKKELFVIIKRFGLYDGIPQTLKSIGKKFKVTRERVRQIEEDAIKKIKEQAAFILLDY